MARPIYVRYETPDDVAEKALQLVQVADFDAGLLAHFAGDRVCQSLAEFDVAAGQAP